MAFAAPHLLGVSALATTRKGEVLLKKGLVYFKATHDASRGCVQYRPYHYGTVGCPDYVSKNLDIFSLLHQTFVPSRATVTAAEVQDGSTTAVDIAWQGAPQNAMVGRYQLCGKRRLKFVHTQRPQWSFSMSASGQWIVCCNTKIVAVQINNAPRVISLTASSAELARLFTGSNNQRLARQVLVHLQNAVTLPRARSALFAPTSRQAKRSKSVSFDAKIGLPVRVACPLAAAPCTSMLSSAEQASLSNGNVEEVAEAFGVEFTADVAAAIGRSRRFSQRLYNLHQVVAPELRDKLFAAYTYAAEQENYPLRKYNYRL